MTDQPAPDFRVLFESAPGLYLILTRDFRIVAVTQAYLNATMTQREAILGRHVFDVFPDNPNDPQATGVSNLRASLERAVATGRPDTMAVQKYDIRKPGAEASFEERYWCPVNSPIAGPDGSVRYIVHKVEDVTAFIHMKQADAEKSRLADELQTSASKMEREIFIRAQELQEANVRLRESEQRFHLLVDNVKDYGIYLLDPDGRITSWNAGAERIKGYTAKEIVGQHYECLFPEDHKKSGKPARLLETAAQTGRVESEGWRVRKDGSRFWANSVVTVVRDAEGKLRGFATVSRDMTERRKAEEALRRSEERLQVAVDSAQMGVWGYDFSTDRSERSLRHDQIMGYSTPLAEWGFATFMKQVVPEDEALARRQFQDAQTTGRLNLECRIRWPDGSLHWVSAQGKVTRDEQGNPWLMHGVISEITERKRAEEAIATLNLELKQNIDQLESANKELEAFSYSVSHDLRAPLRHIDGFVDLLKAHASGLLDAKGQRYLKIISDSAQQMGRLIDDLLSFSRMGRVEMRRVRFALKQMAEVCIEETATETAGRSVDWKVGELPVVDGDPAMLRQVFINLLGNAVKYTRMRERAVIEIGANGSGGEHVIYVRDNGVGFDANYTHKLFGVFQRLHRSDEFEGTGIGLANVRRIVSRHGGRTWAESIVNGGATFYFSLPKIEEKSA